MSRRRSHWLHLQRSSSPLLVIDWLRLLSIGCYLLRCDDDDGGDHDDDEDDDDDDDGGGGGNDDDDNDDDDHGHLVSKKPSCLVLQKNAMFT